MRIKSVTNIKKITSAMKMVAASKMRKAQASQVQAQGLPIAFLKMFGEETSAISTWNKHKPVRILCCGAVDKSCGLQTCLCARW